MWAVTLPPDHRSWAMAVAPFPWNLGLGPWIVSMYGYTRCFPRPSHTLFSLPRPRPRNQERVRPSRPLGQRHTSFLRHYAPVSRL
ncbi:hypothetical protein LY76DRAFT_436873 [Colletotrichum caudatum]|nr:hypothetical protein LY76DRAFT_436873 [Colletotrichum caudatum]